MGKIIVLRIALSSDNDCDVKMWPDELVKRSAYIYEHTNCRCKEEVEEPDKPLVQKAGYAVLPATDDSEDWWQRLAPERFVGHMELTPGSMQLLGTLHSLDHQFRSTYKVGIWNLLSEILAKFEGLVKNGDPHPIPWVTAEQQEEVSK